MSEEQVFVISYALLISMKIVCFILGYLTIRLGYKLIGSGIKGEFKFSAKFGGLKADLASISPGLLFVLLGVFLIGYAIYVEKSVEVVKKPSTSVEESSPAKQRSFEEQPTKPLLRSAPPKEEYYDEK